MNLQEFWSLYGEWVIVALTFLAGLVVTSGRPTPTLIKFIQWVKLKLNLSSNSAATLKWVVAGVLSAVFMVINGDLVLDWGALSPGAFLALMYLFQNNLHDWYKKLEEAGALRLT